MQDSSSPSKREHKRLRNQLRKASEAALPAKPRKILEEVAQSSLMEEDGEARFTIGHQYYRDDLCKVKSMPTSPLRKTLEGYKNRQLYT